MNWRKTFLAGLVLLAAACGQTPTSPHLSSGGGILADGASRDGVSATTARKPGPTSTFGFQFVDGLNGPDAHPNDISDEAVASEVSGGPTQLTGTVSGTAGSRIFALAGGPLSLTIVNVRRDHAGPGCGTEVETLLRTKQLVGAPLSGTVSKLVVSEADDTVNLVVDGIAGADGQTWTVFLFSTSGSKALISEAGGTLSVVQNYGEVNFRVPGRGNKNVEAYGACKLYFGFSLTPSP